MRHVLLIGLSLGVVNSLSLFAEPAFAGSDSSTSSAHSVVEQVKTNEPVTQQTAESKQKQAELSEERDQKHSGTDVDPTETDSKPDAEADDSPKSTTDETPRSTGHAHDEKVEHAAKKQEKADQAMVNAANKIEGVEIDPEIFKAEKKGFTLGKLNPTRWIFKPITDIGKQVVHLEKEIMRLQAPIASLQKPMSELRDDMTRVKSEMNDLQTDISGVGGAMGDVDGRLARIESQLGKMYGPVVTLKDPVVALKEPVVGVNQEMTTLKADLKDLKDVVSLTSTLILVAVVAVGILVVVGLPLGTALVWKHRRAIVKKFETKKDGLSTDPIKESESSKQEAFGARH